MYGSVYNFKISLGGAVGNMSDSKLVDDLFQEICDFSVYFLYFCIWTMCNFHHGGGRAALLVLFWQYSYTVHTYT